MTFHMSFWNGSRTIDVFPEGKKKKQQDNMNLNRNAII